MISVDPADSWGSRLLESRGNASPGSLALWNHALRMHGWDVVIDAGSQYGELLVGAELPERSRVVAFESNPARRPYLERTLQAWSREVELAHAETVGAALERALGAGAVRNACVRLAGGDELVALEAASRSLAGLERWIIMVEILHLSPEEVAALVRHQNVYLHDTKTGHLIRVHSESPAVIHRLLASGWVYPQDALLMSSADLVPQW